MSEQSERQRCIDLVQLMIDLAKPNAAHSKEREEFYRIVRSIMEFLKADIENGRVVKKRKVDFSLDEIDEAERIMESLK